MPEHCIAARHGAASAYPHPDLEPVLADTYGVVIWHEQIIRIFTTLTGCDLALSDIARGVLGDEERLAGIRAWFWWVGWSGRSRRGSRLMRSLRLDVP
ncbi:hypothetical protein QFZ68_007138 [Streptomyces sp. V1I6]|nr:hypothetical protein [Streptomyces sp. V1I6]